MIIPQEHHYEVDNCENLYACVVACGLSCTGDARDERFAALAASALDALDPDKDGTVDLDEVKAAASALFDKLDVDHDGPLDRKELKDRVSAEDWKIADPDNDKTISKDKYLAFVEVAFKRANPDNDAAIEAKELKSPAGRTLVRLLK